MSKTELEMISSFVVSMMRVSSNLNLTTLTLDLRNMEISIENLKVCLEKIRDETVNYDGHRNHITSY